MRQEKADGPRSQRTGGRPSARHAPALDPGWGQVKSSPAPTRPGATGASRARPFEPPGSTGCFAPTASSASSRRPRSPVASFGPTSRAQTTEGGPPCASEGGGSLQSSSILLWALEDRGPIASEEPGPAVCAPARAPVGPSLGLARAFAVPSSLPWSSPPRAQTALRERRRLVLSEGVERELVEQLPQRVAAVPRGRRALEQVDELLGPSRRRSFVRFSTSRMRRACSSSHGDQVDGDL